MWEPQTLQKWPHFVVSGRSRTTGRTDQDGKEEHDISTVLRAQFFRSRRRVWVEELP